jgi:hypothetical protein
MVPVGSSAHIRDGMGGFRQIRVPKSLRNVARTLTRDSMRILSAMENKVSNARSRGQLWGNWFEDVPTFANGHTEDAKF